MKQLLSDPPPNPQTPSIRKRRISNDRSWQGILRPAQNDGTKEPSFSHSCEFVIFLVPSPFPFPFPIPLPVQRLSIFSILGPKRAKKLSIGVYGFTEKQRKSTASVQGEGQGEGSSHIRCCVTAPSLTMSCLWKIAPRRSLDSSSFRSG